jgi:hypothetical protein
MAYKDRKELFLSPHEKLFNRYCGDLREVKAEVDLWWRALLVEEVKRDGDDLRGRREVRRRWPSGPGAHPRVIAVVRKYYLACLALNEQLEDEGGEVVEPAVFLAEWLLDPGSEDLVGLTESLSYWPVGFDSEGDVA